MTQLPLRLYAKGGALGVGRIGEDGRLQCEELRRTHTIRRADKAGTYRWYNDYALPDDLGGDTVPVRLHGNDDDAKRKLNRTENLRPIPPPIRSSPTSSAAATTPSPSTETSTTLSSSAEPTPSAPAARPSTSSATPSW